MGAETTSTHLIFFISATLVATAAAGTFASIAFGLTDKMSVKAANFEQELDTDVTIVNDPHRVVTSPNTLFYVKNTGGRTLDVGRVTVILDGAVVPTHNTLLGNEVAFVRSAVAQLQYNATLPAGDHTVRVVVENGVFDDMSFRV